MKMLVVFENGNNMILNCETTTIERINYLNTEYKIIEIFYIK